MRLCGGPCTNPKLVNLTTGLQQALVGLGLAADQYAEVDVANSTIRLNGRPAESLDAYRDWANSSFWCWPRARTTSATSPTPTPHRTRSPRWCSARRTSRRRPRGHHHPVPHRRRNLRPHVPRVITDLFGEGIRNVSANEFRVIQRATGANMTVTIQMGAGEDAVAYIKGDER